MEPGGQNWNTESIRPLGHQAPSSWSLRFLESEKRSRKMITGCYELVIHQKIVPMYTTHTPNMNFKLQLEVVEPENYAILRL